MKTRQKTPSKHCHILVTGGCGFIGSNFIRHAFGRTTGLFITNLDLLTYSGNTKNLNDIVDHENDGSLPRYRFIQENIENVDFVANLIRKSIDDIATPPIDAIVHFAAESHVDRSIIGPLQFFETNVLGTAALVEAVRIVRNHIPKHFRFIHVSTDEVYGDLRADEPPNSESKTLVPTSPYAASKASSDLIVGSYFRTFDLPAIVTRCSNNYGPFQYPEKLIPLMVTKALNRDKLPVYGNGANIRNWVHVDDHCAALWALLHRGRLGTCYNIGGDSELSNLEIVRKILSFLDLPETLITFVTDRPAHDERYSLETRRIREHTGWKPTIPFDDGLESTIDWYRNHQEWWKPLLPESNRVLNELYSHK
jgi:dTDP-glucose 4,6-dehydratase